MNAKDIRYNPFRTNNNAYVSNAAKAAALTPPTPNVWVPGWGTNLGIR